jgi:hypothetical protein
VTIGLPLLVRVEIENELLASETGKEPGKLSVPVDPTAPGRGNNGRVTRI